MFLFLMFFITVGKRSCGKVMFLHLSVSYSIHGGVSAPVHAGIHTPPGQTPPWQTATAADGMHPTGMYYVVMLYFYRLQTKFGAR